MPRFQTAGFGVFAGRDFKKDEVVVSSWMTLFLPNTFPGGLPPWYYAQNHNKTHVVLPLGHGLIANHHESANVIKDWADNSKDNFVFKVRYANHNVHSKHLERYIYILSIDTQMHFMHTRICVYLHGYTHIRYALYACTHISKHVCFFKDPKDIATYTSMHYLVDSIPCNDVYIYIYIYI